MTEELILSEIQQLPESLKQEVLHFVRFLQQKTTTVLQPTKPESTERIFGVSKGKYRLAEDFDAPLDDFKEYI